MGFFVPNVWLVPFMFFVSLSLNDSVLPGTMGSSSVGVIGAIFFLSFQIRNHFPSRKDTGDGVSAKAGSLLKKMFGFLSRKRDKAINSYAPNMMHQAEKRL